MNRLFALAIAGMLSLFVVPGAIAQTDTVASMIGKSETQKGIDPDRVRTMTGEIQAIDPEQGLLVVKNRRWEKGFYFNEETQVKKGRAFLTQEDLKLGMKVKVAYKEIDGKMRTHLVRLQK